MSSIYQIVIVISLNREWGQRGRERHTGGGDKEKVRDSGDKDRKRGVETEQGGRDGQKE